LYVFRLAGPHIYRFNTSALATNPAWHVLTYNGVGSLTTPRNRVDVLIRWGHLRRDWHRRRGWQLDEFPYASTAEGGQFALGKMVPGLQNSFQGAYLSAFYAIGMKGVRGPFIVAPVPL
jgi:hypothetical protein